MEAGESFKRVKLNLRSHIRATCSDPIGFVRAPQSLLPDRQLAIHS